MSTHGYHHVFPPTRHIPGSQSCENSHSHRDGDRNPHETEETRSFKASNFLFFPPPAETKQMQSRNKETIHRRSHSSRCSHRKLRPHRGEVHGKQADPRLTKRLIFRDSVNKNNYDTLITALILAGLVFWLMAPTAAAPHRWSPETSGARSDPVLPSCGETMILSAHRIKSAQCSCQECLQLHRIKHSSNAIFTVCDVGQSAFHRLSNDV